MSEEDQTEQPTPIVRRLTRRLDGFISVDEAVVTYPRYDGEQVTVTRMSVERGDSAAVLAVDPGKRIVWLTEQFRYPTLAKGPGWLTEVAAGQIDALEEPEAAARRETLEEIGIEPAALERIGLFYLSPGGASERVHLYFACVPSAHADEARAKQLRDQDEDIQIIEQDLDAFLADAFAGRISDAKTLIAAYWLDKHRQRLQL